MRMEILLVILVLGGIVPAYSAQLDVDIPADATEITPSYKFLRVVFFEYPDGGKLADMLQGKDGVVSFSADSKTSGVPQLISKLNTQLTDSLSGALVDDIKIKYKATLDVYDESASIEYNIELIPTIKNHAITVNSETYIDSDWRGIKFSGPILIETKYGEYDINSPESVLRVLVPELLQEIQNTDAKEVLDIEILDASGISNLSLERWHFLFDPTGILEESKNVGFKESSVISHFSMGECSFKAGMCKDRTWAVEFILDKKYIIKAIESQDDATILIEGYGSVKTIGGSEVFGVQGAPPVAHREKFPVDIIYGMAGMAAVGGAGIFIISHLKLKKEARMGSQQTGIDPSRLRAYKTSDGSGGYQTVRGEAQFIDDSDYQKTRSVYDEKRDDSAKSGTKGALPKR